MCSKGRFTGSWKTYLGGDSGGREASGALEIRTWSAPTCVFLEEKKRKKMGRAGEKEREREKRGRVLAGTHRSTGVIVQMRRSDETCKNLHLTFHKHWLRTPGLSCNLFPFVPPFGTTEFRIILSEACTRLGWAIANWLYRMAFWAKRRSLLYSSSGKLWAAA